MKINKLLSLLAAFTAVLTFLACDSGGGSGDPDDELKVSSSSDTSGGSVKTPDSSSSSDDGNGNETEGSLEGTWKLDNGNAYIKFNDKNVELSSMGIPMAKGTYSTSDNKLTMTHIHGDFIKLIMFLGMPIGIFESKWYSEEEMVAQMESKTAEEFYIDVITAEAEYVGVNLNDFLNNLSEDQRAEMELRRVHFIEQWNETIDNIDEMFFSLSSTYSLKNNKLTITYNSGAKETYTRE